jgi:hypothetical protein
MGFITEKQESRLLFLKVMGGNNTPKAIVGIPFPGENFEEIVPGMKWETHLLFAASHYQIEWGILTNGLQLKIFNFGGQGDQPPLLWPDLDGIIEYEKLDSFFSIYEVFSFIKGDINKQPRVKRKQEIKIKRQYSSDMPKALLNILEVCKEMSENGNDYNRACEVVTNMRNLSSPHTVPDACTRRIGINTGGFRKLYANKRLLIDHLINNYPNFSEEITKALSRDS